MAKNESEYGEPVTLDELKHHYDAKFLTFEQFMSLITFDVFIQLCKSKKS